MTRSSGVGGRSEAATSPVGAPRFSFTASLAAWSGSPASAVFAPFITPCCCPWSGRGADAPLPSAGEGCASTPGTWKAASLLTVGCQHLPMKCSTRESHGHHIPPSQWQALGHGQQGSPHSHLAHVRRRSALWSLRRRCRCQHGLARGDAAASAAICAGAATSGCSRLGCRRGTTVSALASEHPVLAGLQLVTNAHGCYAGVLLALK